MAMSPEIESVQALRGHRHTLGSHDPRSQVATEYVENLEIDQLGAVQGNPRVGKALTEPRPRSCAEKELDNRGGVQDGNHADSASAPFLPQDLGGRRIELDRRQLGNAREHLFPGGA